MQTYELKIVRTFNAPRELVWKAWTDPAMATRWMGPRGFQCTEFVTSTNPGDRWHLKMQGCRPGTEQLSYLAQGGVIKEVRPPELLVYTFAWDDRSCVGLGDSAFKENTVTVKFEEKGKQTMMTFTQGPFATEGERDGHNGGWNSAFDCFAEFMLAEAPYVEPDPSVVSTELHLKRFFAAPRDLVFDAWTDPAMLAQWWGPRHFTCTVHQWDPQRGGAILLDMNGPDGKTYPMGGRFIEVYPPYRLHFISSALDEAGNAIFENWNSIFLEEVDGGTMVTLDVHVMTQTDAAPQYLKGMTMGWTMTLDKLKEFIEARQ
jgi:uncharacterized protein YndB with AHSA1/START domain